MLFTGREVRIGKTCARDLEYGPRPRAQFFPIRTSRPVNNIFIFSNICEFTGQSLKVAGTRVTFH